MEGKRCEASPQAAPNMLIKREVDSQYNVGLNPAILVGTGSFASWTEGDALMVSILGARD